MILGDIALRNADGLFRLDGRIKSASSPGVYGDYVFFTLGVEGSIFLEGKHPDECLAAFGVYAVQLYTVFPVDVQLAAAAHNDFAAAQCELRSIAFCCQRPVYRDNSVRPAACADSNAAQRLHLRIRGYREAKVITATDVKTFLHRQLARAGEGQVRLLRVVAADGQLLNDTLPRRYDGHRVVREKYFLRVEALLDGQGLRCLVPGVALGRAVFGKVGRVAQIQHPCRVPQPRTAVGVGFQNIYAVHVFRFYLHCSASGEAQALDVRRNVALGSGIC